MLGLLNVLKVIVKMVTKLSHFLTEENTLENLKITKNTNKELSREYPEQNTLKNGKNEMYGQGTYTWKGGDKYVE